MKISGKLLSLLMVMMLSLSLCSCGGEKAEESQGVPPSKIEEGEEGIANPWSTAKSLQEAAEKAGLEKFSIPEGTEISLGPVSVKEYRYMEGIAEAYIAFPAVDMSIRKGTEAALAESGDISGDYNEYAYEWTQDINGTEVRCFGNREGEATKAMWNIVNNYFSITAYGMGGDTDYGLGADDLNTLVSGIK